MSRKFDDILKNAQNRLENIKARRKEVEQLEQQLEDIAEETSEIVDALRGLEETKKGVRQRRGRMHERDYDPGKYGPAYFYVKEITKDNVIHALDFKPHLMHECPKCKSETPVLMRYYQTDDSVDGDTWEKTAFTICCGKINVIQKNLSDYRFL